MDQPVDQDQAGSTDKLAAISGTTALAGVLGDPVRHSLSPAMHNAALAALGLDWVYLALPVAASELGGVVRALEALDCRGLNVTLPHKQAVAALASELTPLAQRLGAVNTLVRRAQGGWLGTNTDVEGFLAPLRSNAEAGPGAEVGTEARVGAKAEAGTIDWRGRTALVLGCGGSARAVVAGLAELGLGRIQVAGRRAASLESFLAGCQPWAPGLEAVAWGEGTGAGTDAGTAAGSAAAAHNAMSAALAVSDLVVNTTPVGMASPNNPLAAEACPLTALELEQLQAGATVYDLIYVPRPTTLLRRAAERGCRTVDGLEMLVQQGAASLRLWSGVAEVPLAAMRQAALQQLAG
ncbi:MAG: shikimate dehydrogenase [Synechococcaceae cyanobacterium ELA263]